MNKVIVSGTVNDAERIAGTDRYSFWLDIGNGRNIPCWSEASVKDGSAVTVEGELDGSKWSPLEISVKKITGDAK